QLALRPFQWPAIRVFQRRKGQLRLVCGLQRQQLRVDRCRRGKQCARTVGSPGFERTLFRLVLTLRHHGGCRCVLPGLAGARPRELGAFHLPEQLGLHGFQVLAGQLPARNRLTDRSFIAIEQGQLHAQAQLVVAQVFVQLVLVHTTPVPSIAGLEVNGGASPPPAAGSLACASAPRASAWSSRCCAAASSNVAGGIPVAPISPASARALADASRPWRSVTSCCSRIVSSSAWTWSSSAWRSSARTCQIDSATSDCAA